MNCNDLKTLLSAYEDNELEADQRMLVEEHLSTCPECRVELTEYGKIRSLMTSLQAIPTNTNIKETIMSNINSPEKQKPWLRPILVGVPICIALVVILSLVFSGVSNDVSTIIAKAYAVTAELESYRYTKDEYMQLKAEDKLAHGYTVYIEYSYPDNYYIRSEITEENPHSHRKPGIREIIRVGDLVYNRPYSFIKDTSEYFEQTDPTEDQTLGILSTISDTNILKDEIIEGTDCYHYEGIVDNEKYIEWSRDWIRLQYERLTSVLPGSEPDYDEYENQWEAIFRSTDKQFEIWIGKSDNLIRRLKIIHQDNPENAAPGNINAYLNVSYLNYYDINEPIIIEQPLDESGELLEGWSVYTLEDE
ncbi:MAG: zf-HC2 domain-containing protein [Dehalococcoidales bacterium]|nr:MAG: zf-HC2 domain-containing protein [Dehalococcoidales bacterium]